MPLDPKNSQKNKNFLAIIPARSGSKGLSHKNIKLLNKKPLMAHTIKAATRSKVFDEVMVSTDSADYQKIAQNFGASVPFLRSKKNARDESKNIDVVLEVLAMYQDLGVRFQNIAILQPTSPFRNEFDIRGAHELFMKCGRRGLVSVHEVKDHPILVRQMDEKNRLKNLLDLPSTVRRQDFPPFFKVNGAIYMHAVQDLTPETSLNDSPIGFVMGELNGLDIDGLMDFEVAQILKNIKI